MFLEEETRDFKEGEILLLRVFVFTLDLDDTALDDTALDDTFLDDTALDETVLDELERLESDLRVLEGKDLLFSDEETVLEREEERVFLEAYDFIEDFEL